MYLDFGPAIAQYADARKAMFGSAPTKSALEVQGMLGDLWAKLLALGDQIDWKTVFSELWVIIGKLFGGMSVTDIIAWLISLFPPKPPVIVP